MPITLDLLSLSGKLGIFALLFLMIFSAQAAEETDKAEGLFMEIAHEPKQTVEVIPVQEPKKIITILPEPKRTVEVIPTQDLKKTIAIPLAPNTVRTDDVFMEITRVPKEIVEVIPVHDLKRKIAISQFDVTNTMHVDDIDNIYDGLPTLLSSRLHESGDFLTVYDGHALPADADAAQAVILIAGRTGAQFLISGKVLNAGTDKQKGILGTPVGGYKKRYLDIELDVYDGYTGNRLLRQRYSEQAQGDLTVGNNKPFGSTLFLDTEFGKAFNRLLDAAVKDLQSKLKNVPFSAHLVRVQDKNVYLDAGADSLLQPGDKLVAYVKGAAILGINGKTLGAAERAVDTLTLTHVQPQFSIAELSEAAVKNGIKAGHIARISLTEYRELTAKQLAIQQKSKAEQDAKEEAERSRIAKIKQDETDRKQAKQAEIERIQEQKRAKAQAILDAKEAKLKALNEAKIKRNTVALEAKVKRNSAAQEARDREIARLSARAAIIARTAEQKRLRDAEALRIKSEKTAVAQAAAATRAAELQARQEAQVEAARLKDLELKARQEAQAAADLIKAEADRIKAEQEAQAQALAKAEAQRAAELKARLEAQAETARINAEELAQAEAARLKAKEQAESRATTLKAKAKQADHDYEAELETRHSSKPAGSNRASVQPGMREPKARREPKLPEPIDELSDEPEFKTDDDVTAPLTDEQAAQAEAEEEAWLEKEYKAASEIKAAELKDIRNAKKGAPRSNNEQAPDKAR
jgi:Flagellar assembly protein T, middle domain